MRQPENVKWTLICFTVPPYLHIINLNGSILPFHIYLSVPVCVCLSSCVRLLACARVFACLPCVWLGVPMCLCAEEGGIVCVCVCLWVCLCSSLQRKTILFSSFGVIMSTTCSWLKLSDKTFTRRIKECHHCHGCQGNRIQNPVLENSGLFL